MAMAPWPSQRKSLPTNVQREFRGVNRLDALTIDDVFASDMSNLSSRNFTVLSTRPGFSLMGTGLPARILGLGVWKDNQLHAVSNGAWYMFNGAAWIPTGVTGLNAVANWSFTNFLGGFSTINLIGANGVDSVKAWDGATLTNLANAPVGLNFIETYADRLWGAVANTLYFSEWRVGTNWTTTAGAESDPGFITVETPNGELLSGIRAGQRRLVLFKPNSIFNLYGSSAQDFTLQQVSSGIGAISNQAITNISGQIYFVHQTGIYVYEGGVRPVKNFSQRVQNYVDRITPSSVAKVCCGTDGVNLYVGLPIDGATEPNVLLVYSTEFDTWDVWHGYAPLNIATVWRQAYIGGVEGQVRQVGGVTDNGAPITGYWTSKVFGGQSHSQIIRWKRAWIVAHVPAGSSLSVYLTQNPDGVNDFQLVQNVPASSAVSSSRVIIPTTIASLANFITLKFVFTGVVTIKEWSREEDSLPIR